MQIRYHLDESVNHAVAIGMRSPGIDVTTATDANLIGANDEAHLEFARLSGRVAVSHDSDFLRLAAAGMDLTGIAYCHQRERTIGQIVAALVRLWRARSAEEVRGQVVFL